MNIYQHTNPEKNNTPFTYLIGWSALNKWYYGCRYRNGCHPTDLWTTYFTSSNEVKQFRKEHGEPDVIQVRHTFSSNQKAKIWEAKVQTAIPLEARKLCWLNKKFGNTFKNCVDGTTGRKRTRKESEKQKETLLRKYGVDNPGKTEKSKSTAKARMLSSANPAYNQTEQTRNKIANTNLTRMAAMTAEERSIKFGTFGEENYFHTFNKSDRAKQLRQQNLEKYSYCLISSIGEKFTTLNLNQFCITHNLNRDILRKFMFTQLPIPPGRSDSSASRINSVGWHISATLI